MLPVVMNSRMIFHLSLEFFHSTLQAQLESRPGINHTKHRSLVICFLLVKAIWCVVEFVMGLVPLDPEQREAVHLLSIASYAFTTSLTELVAFQFIFFSSALLHRFEIFTEKLKIDFQSRQREDSIRIFSQRYSTLSAVMMKINATFSIQVWQSRVLL